jgi:hypothetical protein
MPEGLSELKKIGKDFGIAEHKIEKFWHKASEKTKKNVGIAAITGGALAVGSLLHGIETGNLVEIETGLGLTEELAAATGAGLGGMGLVYLLKHRKKKEDKEKDTKKLEYVISMG